MVSIMRTFILSALPLNSADPFAQSRYQGDHWRACNKYTTPRGGTVSDEPDFNKCLYMVDEYSSSRYDDTCTPAANCSDDFCIAENQTCKVLDDKYSDCLNGVNCKNCGAKHDRRVAFHGVKYLSCNSNDDCPPGLHCISSGLRRQTCEGLMRHRYSEICNHQKNTGETLEQTFVSLDTPNVDNFVKNNWTEASGVNQAEFTYLVRKFWRNHYWLNDGLKVYLQDNNDVYLRSGFEAFFQTKMPWDYMYDQKLKNQERVRREEKKIEELKQELIRSGEKEIEELEQERIRSGEKEFEELKQLFQNLEEEATSKSTGKRKLGNLRGNL